MSDAWEEIQALKSKRNSLREKLEKRKKERQHILGATLAGGSTEKAEGSPAAAGQEKAVPSPSAPKTDGKLNKCAMPKYQISFSATIVTYFYS